MSKGIVKGMTLTDYFRLRDSEPFEDSTELECLVGDLITKPQNSNPASNSNPPIPSNTQPDNQFLTKTSSIQKQPHIITEQLEEKKAFSMNKKSPLTFRQSHLESQLESKLQSNYQPQTTTKMEKLSSLEFRSSSIKVYNSQKMRIRQVSNSPYQKQFSKPKESLVTLYGGSANLIPTLQRNPIGTDHHLNPRQLQGELQKYFRNGVSPIPKEQKMMINLRSIKQMKDLERGDDVKKKKMEGVYNTMNAYAKKVREQQRVKHNL